MDVLGNPGELIERFLDAINASPAEQPLWWNETAFWLRIQIGGAALRVRPEIGTTYAAGTVGEERNAAYDKVSREEFFRRVESRLLELVAGGLHESFLIRALRNGLTEWFGFLADPDRREARLAELRGSLDATANDPERLAKFREAMTEQDPAAAQLSDDEVAARLRSAAASDFVAPTTPDKPEECSAMGDIWAGRQRERLPDEVIELWEKLFGTRGRLEGLSPAGPDGG
ncbi:MAG: hypothetical protein NVSMB32_08980 [Actinomycetota bacterium]